MKTIPIYDSKLAETSPPENLIKYIAWLEAMLEMVPDQFRDSCLIEIDAENCHGDYFVEFKITYERLETAEELAKKAKDEANLADKKKRKDMVTLAELKAKYPDS